MKALVTGGSGFLGSKLSLYLLEKGHEVRILVRDLAKGENSDFPASPSLSYAQGHLGNESSLKQACEGIDWVFHCAGVVSYNPAKAGLMYETNVVGSRNLATAALEAGVKRFVQVSSTAAIGISRDPRAPMNEETPFNARSLGLAYFDTKYDGEMEVLKLVERGLSGVIVNPGSLLGPGDKRRYEKGYAGLIYKYKPRFLFHGGINFVDVGDVVRGIVAAVERGRVGERYILGGENLGFGDLIQRVNSIIGRPSPSIFVPQSLMGVVSLGLKGLNLLGVDLHMSPELVRQVCTWYLYVDSAKAIRELDYRPKRIDSAISGTLQWLKDMQRI